MALVIRTNNQPRPVIRWPDLTPKEAREFYYLNSETRRDGAEFFRYCGHVFDIGEFMATDGRYAPDPFIRWHGYFADSYFSGVLLRYTADLEEVVVATYFQ